MSTALEVLTKYGEERGLDGDLVPSILLNGLEEETLVTSAIGSGGRRAPEVAAGSRVQRVIRLFRWPARGGEVWRIAQKKPGRLAQKSLDEMTRYLAGRQERGSSSSAVRPTQSPQIGHSGHVPGLTPVRPDREGDRSVDAEAESRRGEAVGAWPSTSS